MPAAGPSGTEQVHDPLRRVGDRIGEAKDAGSAVLQDCAERGGIVQQQARSFRGRRQRRHDNAGERALVSALSAPRDHEEA